MLALCWHYAGTMLDGFCKPVQMFCLARRGIYPVETFQRSLEGNNEVLLCLAKRVDGFTKPIQLAKNQLDNLGLTIHPQKTRVVRSYYGVTFLGERLPSTSC